jgi:hypothetical protein
MSPLTLVYIHSVLKSALEQAVREEEIPHNVARKVRTGTPRLRRFNPLTADERGSSSPQSSGTVSPPCSNSLCAPDCARANFSACAGKTSTSTAAPLASIFLDGPSTESAAHQVAGGGDCAG